MEGEEVVHEESSQPAASSPDVFSDAYQGALQGTLYASAQDSQSGTVALAPEQWDQIQGSFRVLATCSLFSLLLVSAVLGAVLWRVFVDGWRR